MNLNQVLNILRARWQIMTGIAAGIFVVVVALSLMWPKQYLAVSSLVIDAKTDPVSAGASGMGQQLLATYVNTQADVIASQRVAEKVVSMLHLDADSVLKAKWTSATQGREPFRVWLSDYLVNNKLTVAPLHDSPTHLSNVIEISVSWPDPAGAAALSQRICPGRYRNEHRVES